VKESNARLAMEIEKQKKTKAQTKAKPKAKPRGKEKQKAAALPPIGYEPSRRGPVLRGGSTASATTTVGSEAAGPSTRTGVPVAPMDLTGVDVDVASLAHQEQDDDMAMVCLALLFFILPQLPNPTTPPLTRERHNADHSPKSGTSITSCFIPSTSLASLYIALGLLT
jgi:hypothetical protein